MQITDSKSIFDHGGNNDVDTTAEVLTTTKFRAKRGVLIVADSANTDDVWVGNSDVTAGGTDATDGVPIAPGQNLFLEVNDPSQIYVIGGAVNQKVYWIAV